MKEHLSTALFRETRGGAFFRVLAGRNAPFYADVLDALDLASSEHADGLPREAALAIIADTLEHHPGFEFEDDDDSPALSAADLREKSRILLDHLLKCHWLEEPPRRDWRRMILFDAHGSTLMAALRRIAWPDAAVFTDKLTGACAMLGDEATLAEQPWQTVENCLSNVRDGINELR